MSRRRRRPWQPAVGERVIAFGRFHGRVREVTAFDVVVDLDQPAPTGNGDHSHLISAPLARVEAEREGT